MDCEHVSTTVLYNVTPIFFVETAAFAIDLQLVCLELTSLIQLSADVLRYQIDGDGIIRTVGIDKIILVKSFNPRYRPAQLKRRAIVLAAARTSRDRSISQPRETWMTDQSSLLQL